MFVAMRLLRRHGIGNAPLESIPAEVFERLHLDPEQAVQAIQHVIDASEEIRSIASSLAAAEYRPAVAAASAWRLTSSSHCTCASRSKSR